MSRDRRENTGFEPIAIIGMAARVPGAASLDEYWANISQGVVSVRTFSEEELRAVGVSEENLSSPSYIRSGAPVEDAESFDAGFFGFSDGEAELMDPQHRMLLECAWEVLEHSGYVPEASPGDIGVYAGSKVSEYLIFNHRPGNIRLAEHENLIAAFQRHLLNDTHFLATRIAYSLNLRGPSLTVQTACSTSLVAVHLACQALHEGECEIALAGGVSFNSPQTAGYHHVEGMIFSADGQARPFDSRASGTVFTGGVGLVALKPLTAARADGDHIYAVIRGSAINNDGTGMKAAFTAPSPAGQVAVVRRALEVSGIRADSISYVEAHGTATRVGDPIEVAALAEVFRRDTDDVAHCALGSVKANIGHTVQAAGIASLIKTALMLEKRKLPPAANFDEPNPKLDLPASPFYINRTLKDWEGPNGVLRAGVSSFGVGGTNSHVIVEEAPPSETDETEQACRLLALSARSPKALRDLAHRYLDYFQSDSPAPLRDVCFTAQVGRAHFAHRAAAVASSPEGLQEALAELASGSGAERQQREEPVAPRTAFLFSGQGSQYGGMGRRLYETEPTFRRILDECDELLRPHMERSLLSVIHAPEGSDSPLDETAYTQPALFAVEYALAMLWRSWGIEPHVVVGHSIGEYPAACFAGVFGLADGLKLIAKRGRLMQALPERGVMWAVFAAEDRVIPLVESCDRASIAAVNGPEQIVLSGDEREVATLVQQLAEQGIEARQLNVSHAFHSPLMEPMVEEFRVLCSSVEFAPPKIEMLTNPTGRLAGVGIDDPEYWVLQVLEPVQFTARLEELRDRQLDVCIEVGAKPTLIGMASRFPGLAERPLLPSIRPGRDDDRQILESLATAYTEGAAVDWKGFNQSRQGRRVPLPTYPFQRRRYWKEDPKRAGAGSQTIFAGSDQSSDHPLLGRRVPSAVPGRQYLSVITPDHPPLLRDHRIHESIIFPGAAFVEMALAAAADAYGAAPLVVENMFLYSALVLDTPEPRYLQTVLKEEGEAGGRDFEIYSRVADEGDEGGWTLHAQGGIRPASTPPEGAPVETLRERITDEWSIAELREWQLRSGTEYRGAFAAIERFWVAPGEALLEIELPEDADLESFHFHPALLDASLQIAGKIPKKARPGAPFINTGWGRVTILERPSARRYWCHLALQKPDKEIREAYRFDFSIYDAEGRIVAEVRDLLHKRARRSAMLGRLSDSQLRNELYETRWQEAPASEAPSPKAPAGLWIILDDEAGLGARLAALAEEEGHATVSVIPGDGFRIIAPGRYAIDPSSPADFERLLREVGDSGAAAPTTIVQLWPCREHGADVSAAAIERAQQVGCLSALHLVQAVQSRGAAERVRLFLVSRGAQPVDGFEGPGGLAHASLWGIGRVISQEHPELFCRLVDLPLRDSVRTPDLLAAELRVFDEERQVGLRRGRRFVPRIQRAELAAGRRPRLPEAPYRLAVSEIGAIENLVLEETDPRTPGPNEVKIEVRAMGLNFKDVLAVLGRLPEDAGLLGRECSGRISAVGRDVTDLDVGDEVMALGGGSFACHMVVHRRCVVRKPAHLTFAETGGIPVTFMAAWYGLRTLADLKAGERVLIHAAAGGVGLAAIQIARAVGAQIFATASREKWDFLKSIGIEHVMDSRRLDFAAEIGELTGGAGVDVVLNSLAGDFISRSVDVLSPGGRFIELGKLDDWDQARVSMIKSGATHQRFELGRLAVSDPEGFAEIFQELINQFESGVLQPLPMRCFGIEEAQQAFRHMANAGHIGKIVLLPRRFVVEDRSPSQPSHEATYLITGGLGSLGIETAGWLIDRGARHLVLVGRSAPTEKAAQAIARMESFGATVHVRSVDVACPEAVAGLIAEIQECMPPLRGVIHAAGVLDDGVLRQQSRKRFEKVMAPKVEGAWNLHEATRSLDLDFFVLYSSISSTWGTPGQGNYAAANAFLDALAHHRRARGLPALSLNWGPWAEAGMAAELSDEVRRRRAALGVGEIQVQRGLRVLGRLLEEDAPQFSVVPVDWSRLLADDSRRNPYFAGIQSSEPVKRADRKPPAPAAVDRRRLAGMPPEKQHAAIVERIAAELARLLSLEADEIDPDRPVDEQGIDSLMAIELQNRLASLFGSGPGMEVFLNGPSVSQIADTIQQDLEGSPADPESEQVRDSSVAV